ncbi:MAG TPA: protein kinase [Gemmataceae bacterium]|nr:protein kinase [Gemmataceae bacterium]
MPATHPTDGALRDFLLGKLPDAESDSIEAHLSECPACLGRAADESAHDTLMDLLASARTRLDADRAVACTPHPDVFSTPALGSVTQTYNGPPTACGNTLALPPELAGHPRYRVLRLLGYGGMGTVWLAEHTVMGRAVALKVVRSEWLARPGAAERFQREVRAAAKLKHEHIATAYDAEQVGDRVFLVMEYVPGDPLSDVVRDGPLPVADACRVVRDAARGLAHAHSAELVHRDVKPGNLIRTPDGMTKVLDFGLVSVAGPEGSALTGENLVMGTPDYIAPEQADNPRAADARSDIYALGCTLYHLLAGRVPYPADSVLRKIDGHRDPACRPAPIPGVSPGLAAVVAKMMAKDPRGRYQTATAVLAALEPYASGTAPLSTAGRPRSVPRLAVAAGLLFVSLAAAVVYKIQRDNEQITITSDDPDIEVAMKRNGDLVRIVDNKTGQRWDLDTRRFRLKPDGSELSIDLPDRDPLTIRRNGDTAVTIRREPAPGPSSPPAGTDPHLIRTFVGHTGTVRTVAYSPDGKYVASGSGWPHSDQTVRLWEVATGRQVWTTDEKIASNAVTFCPGGYILSVGSPTPYLLDAKTGATVRVFETKHTGTLHTVAASPDGRRALTGGDDGVLRVWDVRTGKQLQELPHPPGILVFVAFSPNGRYAASGSNDGTVRVWDTETGKPVKTFEGVPHLIGHAGGFTPDGRHVVFGQQETIVLWEWESGRTRKLDPGTNAGGVLAVAVSADGKRVLSGGPRDNTVRLWDFEQGTLLRAFKGHTDSVWGVAFSPDGRFGLSGSGHRFTQDGPQLGDDLTLRLWRLPDPS